MSERDAVLPSHLKIYVLICVNPNIIKSYEISQKLLSPKHAARGVAHNCPTLSIGTERLTCLNNPHDVPGDDVQLGTPV